jgi:hypothetical protein
LCARLEKAFDGTQPTESRSGPPTKYFFSAERLNDIAAACGIKVTQRYVGD